MSLSRKTAIIAVVMTLSAGAVLASWYDDYDAGVSAAKSGN